MPHVLVAGATGSGKSVCLNAIITGLLFQHGPETLRMVMVDPKMLELSAYNGIPHLVMPVVTEAKRASRALRWAVSEMEKRYKLMATCGARNIAAYNEKVAAGLVPTAPAVGDGEPPPPERLSYVVVVIDELADLMLTAPAEIEEPIARLAQMARAVGIHLVLATQRPSVDVITGVIKANFPSRIAFQVASQDRLAHRARHERRREPARPRRHAVHAGRQARALPRARRVRLGRGDRARGRVLARQGAARRRRCRSPPTPASWTARRRPRRRARTATSTTT